MIIQSGSVEMSSRRTYQRTSALSSSVSLRGAGFTRNRSVQRIHHYSETSDFGEENPNSPSAGEKSGEDVLNKFQQAQSIGSPINIRSTSSNIHTIRAQSINYLMMLLFGKARFDGSSLLSGLEQPSDIAGGGLSQTGGTYTESSWYAETETTSFSTTGTVKTEDGREINFNISMKMSRAFEEAYTGSVSFGALQQQAKYCDPLVINLNTSSASVTDQEFYFDLDVDGKKDHISNLAAGSGFLALDKNGDGIINDGSELFGAKSGDGFADLAAYDQDGNGWIDENDEIFDKLCIWTKDAQGHDTLCAIGKAGVGAIYLGNARTDFSLNSKKDNSANARIRKTGIFLYENGAAGTIQHLDMVKES